MARADGECAVMIFVGLRSGLRQGELIGLRWEDVDLSKGLPSVGRSVTRGVMPRRRAARDARCHSA